MEQLLKNRFVKTLLIIFLPLLFITALFNPIKIVKAADVSSNVTSLTVSPSQINDGGKTTVRFTFDEHSQKINSGDTIRVNWQNSGTVYGSGFKKTIRLMIGGAYVGDMIISDGEAVVTFNEGVKGLQNITGWGEFEIQGRDMTQTSDEHSGTFTINSGGQSVVVTVKKGASGTVGVFYYKTGDMLPEDTEHVRWFLNINNEKAYVDSDIRIEDEIQPGQTLDLNSFDITVGGYRPGHYYGSDAINKFIKAFPGSSISVDATTGKISVLITQGYASLSNFSIMYKTKVDNSEQQTFENHTKAWYKENGKDAIEGKEFNHSVANVKADGGADGNKPTTTEEPTTTTTTEEPTTTTTTEEPTTTTTTEEPTTTTTTEEPTTTTTTEEPTTYNDYRGANNYNDYRGANNYNDYRGANNYNDYRGANNHNDYRGANNHNDYRGANNYNDYRGANNHNDYRGAQQPQRLPRSQQPQRLPRSQQLQRLPRSQQPQRLPRSQQPQRLPRSQ
nr:collagen binding domain-containing protein [Streptococcus suis]